MFNSLCTCWLRDFALLAIVFVFSVSQTLSISYADYSLYTLPGTELSLMLAGEATFNPGGTVTHRHPRGTLYFSSEDIKVLKSPTAKEVYARRARFISKSKSVDDVLDLSQWALENGLLKQSKSLLSTAWKIDRSNMRIRKLAGLMGYINRPVKRNSQQEEKAKNFVGGRNMTLTQSKHFLLMHDGKTEKDPVTRKTRAEMRLTLLEKVYESYFLSFAFRGTFLRPPTEPLIVVLFSNHGDFLQMERRLGGSLRRVAGFYHPKDNISIFYDSGTSEQFQQLMEMDRQMSELIETVKKTRQPGAGELIRFAKTIKLLVDITRESEDVSTVSHEAIHHLAANTGLFQRDGAFVRWVHEGLASFFESAKRARWSGVGVVDTDRIGYYRLLKADPMRGSLEFIVSDLGFHVEEALGNQLPAYGQAWALTHYLFNERFDDLMKFYVSLRELDADNSPRDNADPLLKAFDEAFGDRVTLELEWRRYMRGLRTDLEKLKETY